MKMNALLRFVSAALLLNLSFFVKASVDEMPGSIELLIKGPWEERLVSASLSGSFTEVEGLRLDFIREKLRHCQDSKDRSACINELDIGYNIKAFLRKYIESVDRSLSEVEDEDLNKMLGKDQHDLCLVKGKYKEVVNIELLRKAISSAWKSDDFIEQLIKYKVLGFHADTLRKLGRNLSIRELIEALLLIKAPKSIGILGNIWLRMEEAEDKGSALAIAENFPSLAVEVESFKGSEAASVVEFRDSQNMERIKQIYETGLYGFTNGIISRDYIRRMLEIEPGAQVPDEKIQVLKGFVNNMLNTDRKSRRYIRQMSKSDELFNKIQCSATCVLYLNAGERNGCLNQCILSEEILERVSSLGPDCSVIELFDIFRDLIEAPEIKAKDLPGSVEILADPLNDAEEGAKVQNIFERLRSEIPLIKSQIINENKLGFSLRTLLRDNFKDDETVFFHDSLNLRKYLAVKDQALLAEIEQQYSKAKSLSFSQVKDAAICFTRNIMFGVIEDSRYDTLRSCLAAKGLDGLYESIYKLKPEVSANEFIATLNGTPISEEEEEEAGGGEGGGGGEEEEEEEVRGGGGGEEEEGEENQKPDKEKKKEDKSLKRKDKTRDGKQVELKPEKQAVKIGQNSALAKDNNEVNRPTLETLTHPVAFVVYAVLFIGMLTGVWMLMKGRHDTVIEL